MRTDSRRSTRSRIAARAPISLQPYLLSCINRFAPRNQIAWGEGPSVIATLVMMLGMFFCSHNTLKEVAARTGTHHIDFAPIIAAMTGALLVMIFFSAAVGALSNLYTSKDLDFWLSSPLTPHQFLKGKVCEIFFSTGWMLLVFAIPLYISFGLFSRAGFAYFALTPLLTGGLFVSAVLMGIIAATICAAVMPANYGRQTFGFLAIGAIGLLFICMHAGPGLSAPTAGMPGPSTVSISTLFSGSDIPLLIVGVAIESLIYGSIELAIRVLALAWVIAYLFWAVSGDVFSTLFPRTISRFHSNQSSHRFQTPHGAHFFERLGRFIPRQSRALIAKDLYSFCREITHTLQLIALLTICVLYLYNFSRIQPPTHVGPDVLRVWDVFLILANIILGSMVVLSLAARFVFPSISLEGANLWILQTAPISARDIIRSKYRSWFFPSSVIAMIIFSSGACALGLEPLLVVITLLCGVIITHGIISLALGVGASCARFDWDHPAQLTTSSGNLLFMILGMVLLGITTVPLGLMFGAYMLYPSLLQEHRQIFFLFGAGIGAIVLINVVVGWLALRIGHKALGRKFYPGTGPSNS